VTRNSKPELDILGVIYSTIGFGGLLYGFSDAANDGWDNMRVIISLIVGVVFLLFFIVREFRVEKPILEFRVFRYDMFSLTTIINVIITMAMFSGMLLLPIFLQNIRGFTPLESGLLLLPGALVMGIMSPITGAIFDKVGARWLAVIGLAITTFTTYELGHLTVETTYNHMLMLYTLRMFGMSMLMMPIQTAGLNQLPQHLNAHGSAMSQTLRNIAGALGTAFMVTIFANKATSRGEALVREAGIDPTDAANAAVMQQISMQATVDGINYSFIVATWMTVAALVLAFFIRKTSPKFEKSTNKETVDDTAASTART
jgi:EmrB/QacA subfamily drug resistance transporter